MAASETVKRPASIIAASWGENPERTGHGQETGISAAIWLCSHDAPTEYHRPAFDHFHVLTILLDSARIERWQNGHLVQEGATHAGCSALIFSGTKVDNIASGNWRSVHVYIPVRLLDETAELADLPPLRPDSVEAGLRYDAAICAIGRSFSRELEQGRPGCRLQLDSLGALLCIELLRGANGGKAPRQTRGGLAPWQVKLAREFIADQLDEEVTLAALAETVGLSKHHFARAFKQSTGLSPYRYLIDCRLARAKELLATTELSMAEIAVLVGYEEPTQLCRLFQAKLALSPTAYRRSFTRATRRSSARP